MYTRCAYFTGRPRPGREREFEQRLREGLNRYVGLPGLQSAVLHLAAEAEPGAPALHAVIELRFEDAAAVEAALATPLRHELRAWFHEHVLPLFEGNVAHINHMSAEIRA